MSLTELLFPGKSMTGRRSTGVLSGLLQAGCERAYDQIAEAWYHRRHWTRFRRELEALAEKWGRGRLLNVGCGHGPDFLPFAGRFDLHGVDSSPRMVSMALKYRARHSFEADLVVGDARCLPYADQSFDWAVSVAAYHNIRGAVGRSAAFSDLLRVLRPGGEAFLTVWNRWQPRFWSSGKEALVPWHSRSGTVWRYYYLFSRGELRRSLTEAGFEVLRLHPEQSYRFPAPQFSRNICALVRKPPA